MEIRKFVVIGKRPQVTGAQVTSDSDYACYCVVDNYRLPTIRRTLRGRIPYLTCPQVSDNLGGKVSGGLKWKNGMGTTLESIILEQFSLHPGYTVPDLYKLIYQAVFGVEHLLEDEREAYRLLCKEFNNLRQDLPGERLLELIDPKGIIYRINLRPYKATERNLDRLFDAFLFTRGAITGTKMDFLHLWNEVKQLIEKLSLPFSLKEMKKLESNFQNGDLPILHHSESYVKLNYPSYRLIAVGYVEDLSGE